ncbi:hypothetical protein [Schumannella soli]|uniref:Uncharacterized protein n=1 Tax=Schumannella soli TaxID=2590779 RepID=A0A506Y744_9MICO|nr:hypothetical protein [Schumannella soli]TPW77882.1 hypothetical protein FJ657_04350 [Schumannella soli]
MTSPDDATAKPSPSPLHDRAPRPSRHDVLRLAAVDAATLGSAALLAPWLVLVALIGGSLPALALLALLLPAGVVAVMAVADARLLARGRGEAGARSLAVTILGIVAVVLSWSATPLTDLGSVAGPASLLPALVGAVVAGTSAIALGARPRLMPVGAAATVVAFTILATLVAIPMRQRAETQDRVASVERFGSSVRPWVADASGYHRVWVEVALDDPNTLVAHLRRDGEDDSVPVVAGDILLRTVTTMDGEDAGSRFCLSPYRLELVGGSLRVPMTDPSATGQPAVPLGSACDVRGGVFERSATGALELGRAVSPTTIIGVAASSEVDPALLRRILHSAHEIDDVDYAEMLADESTPRDGVSDYPPGSTHG